MRFPLRLPKDSATGQSRIRRGAARAFTLIELMVVVLIMGILATLGFTAFRSHVDGAKNTEALAMIRSIAAAQERFRAENLVYLSVSGGVTPDLSSFYPTASPSATRWAFWGHSHPDSALWVRLGPKAPGSVMYSFSTVAGLPPAEPTFAGVTAPTWPSGLAEPWYVIQAIGDVNGNGVQNKLVATSLNDKIYQENMGE